MISERRERVTKNIEKNINIAGNIGFSSSQLRAKLFKRRVLSTLPMISLIIVLLVFWWLKLIGITMAGEAFCENDEHIHQLYILLILCVK